MALSDLQTALNGYQAALAADALNPQPTYSLDGQMVDRNKWRESMFKMCMDLQQLINATNPYIVRTKVVV